MKKLTHRRVYIQPSNKCIVINADGLLCLSDGDATGGNGEPGYNGEGSGNIREIESDED